MNNNSTCTDREMAIQEITRGYELIKQLRSILYLGHETQSELPDHGVLFEEALQALTVAITNLKSSTCAKSVEVMSFVSLSDQGSEASNDQIKTVSSGCRKRGLIRSLADNPWTKITYSPHDDGHQWRKYGHKIIKTSKLSRSYYRCTFKDQGCQARKHVQQKDCNIDPPLFSVTYYEKHTCKSNNNYPMISPTMTLDKLVPLEPNLFSFESNANVFFSQESSTVLYSSLKASATQQDPEQKRVLVDVIHNKTIDNEKMESAANSDQDCDLQAMLNTSLQGSTIPASPCLSPTWMQMMSFDDLMEPSFGSI